MANLAPVCEPARWRRARDVQKKPRRRSTKRGSSRVSLGTRENPDGEDSLTLSRRKVALKIETPVLRGFISAAAFRSRPSSSPPRPEPRGVTNYLFEAAIGAEN